MTVQLRKYQIEFTRNLARAVVQWLKVLAVLPTGGGKTKVFIAIADTAIARGKTVLILTETRKIFQQITVEANGLEIKAGAKQMFGVLPGRIYVAMAQTLARRELLISQFAALGKELLIINDEAHVGTASTLLRQLPDAMLLGFTATPDCRAGKHLPELYKHCVVGAQVSDLIDSGFLTPYKHFARVAANLNVLKIKQGDFSEESQQAAFETTGVYDGVVEDLQRVPYRKALIFCASISHAKDMVVQLEYAGYNVAEVHSQCEQSDFNLAAFTYGSVNICVSVGILTKGFDFPSIDLIALVRATTSLPLFCQMVGRGSRLAPGKEIFTVVDYGGNYERFGLWDMDRDWEKLWCKAKGKKSREGEGMSPVKMCSNEDCGALIPASSVICPYCATLMPKDEKETLQGELIEITEEVSKMRGRLISTLDPTELAKYGKIRNRKGFTNRIARAQEQKAPGYLEKYAAAMNYKPGWLHYQQPGTDPIEFYDIVIR